MDGERRRACALVGSVRVRVLAAKIVHTAQSKLPPGVIADVEAARAALAVPPLIPLLDLLANSLCGSADLFARLSDDDVATVLSHMGGRDAARLSVVDRRTRRSVPGAAAARRLRLQASGAIDPDAWRAGGRVRLETRVASRADRNAIATVSSHPISRALLVGIAAAADDVTDRAICYGLADAGVGAGVTAAVLGGLDTSTPVSAEVCSIATDGVHIASGDASGAIRLFDAHSLAAIGGGREDGQAGGPAVAWAQHGECVSGLALAGSVLVSGTVAGGLRIWCVRSSSHVATLAAHTAAVRAIDVGEAAIASGSADRTSRVWHTRTRSGSSECRAAAAHRGEGTAEGTREGRAPLAITPPPWGDRGAADRAADAVWSHPAEVNAVRLAGDVLATGCADSMVRTFSLATGQPTRVFAHGQRGGVCCLALSGSALLSGGGSGDWIVKLWSIADSEASAECVATLEGHTGSVTGVAFVPSRSLVASISADALFVWEPDGVCLEEPTSACTASEVQ